MTKSIPKPELLWWEPLSLSMRDGETLSNFMEESLRAGIQSRKAQQEFMVRGLASRDEARLTDEYYSAKTVFDEFNGMLSWAEENNAK